MKYDRFFGAYKATARMAAGAQFKFVVDGSYEVSFDYPIVYVSGCN